MTIPDQANTDQTQTTVSDKELNFRKMEAYYERQLERERQGRLEAERKVHESTQKKPIIAAEDDDDDETDPYVDHKKLKNKLNKFERKLEEKIEAAAEKKARMMIKEEREGSWMRQNADFENVMQHAERFAQLNPDLAETILQMPEGFERKKLVYSTIKSMGLHKPPEPQQTIQQKAEQNLRSPYYQPSGVGTSPYATGGNFSEQGQKQAYDKMQDLKKRLRL